MTEDTTPVDPAAEAEQAAGPKWTATPKGAVPTRKIISWLLVAAGVLTVVIALVVGLRTDDKAKAAAEFNDDVAAISCTMRGHSADYCMQTYAGREAADAKEEADDRRTLGFVIAGLGVAVALTGAIPLLTDRGRAP